MDSSQKERMIPVLKKLPVLSLSMLLSLSLLPGQASAMDIPENEPPIQTENVEAQDPDAGIAPCREEYYDPFGTGSKGLGVGIGGGDSYGNGGAWGGGMAP